ncbi:MAG: hypothetical protein IOC82_15895 [Aestuariivirga sp.]|uniref:hypothetical protein n=1 Tax=Aestuariivirga sp. TaxID=2650926 RepID=UPI0025C19DAE|nr:hypothetical protein [Aestuariivirga sp.]MCA3562501.1 hypothetical protein [Aestuariivirga sp.]
MSNEITRMFADAATAAKAVEELREEGYDDIHVVNPSTPDVPLSAIAAQIALGRVHLPDARIYAKGVAAGRALVTVYAPFGAGKLAETILDSHSPVNSGIVHTDPPPMWDEAAPLSSTLGMATIINDPDPISKIFGIPAVTSGNCSFSGMIGMQLLTNGELGDRGRVGLPYLSSNPAPLSSALGLPLLTRRQ